MAQDLFLLNRSDVRTIRDIIDEQRKQTANPRLRHGPTFDDHPAPDIYLAFVPPPGINPPLSFAPAAAYGDNAVPYTKQDALFSTATCQIYQLTSTGEAQAISNLTYTVYSTTGVPPNSWVIVGRSKSGDWWVINTPPDLEWVGVLNELGQPYPLDNPYAENSTTPPFLSLLGRSISGITTTAGSGVITNTTANFTQDDVGSYVGGAFGLNYGRGGVLIVNAVLTAGKYDLTVTIQLGPLPTFNNDDVGSLLAGPGIPANTTVAQVLSNNHVLMSNSATSTHSIASVYMASYPTIASVESPTQATMNVAALADSSGNFITVSPTAITVYGGTVMLWQPANGVPNPFTKVGTFYPSAPEIPSPDESIPSVWLLEVNGHPPKPGIYPCRYVDTDAGGIRIYAIQIYESPNCPILFGPFLNGLSCVNGVPYLSSAYICVPDGNICEAYIAYCDNTYLPDGSPTCCPGAVVAPTKGTPPPLPLPTPVPIPPSLPPTDPFFFGSDYP